MAKRAAVWAAAGVATIGMAWYLVNPFGTATWDVRARLLGYVPFVMQSRTMMPAVRRGEIVRVNTAAYATKEPEHGDVILFWYPPERSVAYMFRVIGRPGDRVRVTPEGAWLNGRLLEEPYVSTQQGRQAAAASEEFVVPDDSLFVLGDQRMISNDSRYWGPVPRDAVIGKHVLATRPLAFRAQVTPERAAAP